MNNNVNDSLGDRMKRYEAVSSQKLTPKTPVIIRVDGKSFHTFTKNLVKPFDLCFIGSMCLAADLTMRKITGCKLAYVQSDECTFVLTDTEKLDTQMWFDGEVNKLVSITASMFSVYFNYAMYRHKTIFDRCDNLEMTSEVFDARAFNVPHDDVQNCFIWRQKDWARNSLQMFAHQFFTDKELHGKSHAEIHEMLHGIGKNWAKLNDQLKNGTFILEDGSRIYNKLNYNDIDELIKD